MKKSILKSGIEVITLENENTNICTLSYMIKSGSFNELPHERGIAHLIEHMLFKGTINRNYSQINSDVENYGGFLNAFTSYENTTYYSSILGEYWDKALDVLSDLIFNHTIPEEELIKEKNVVIEEINMYNEQSDNFIINQLFNNIFKEHKNRQSVIGTIDSINKINRNNIIDFINRNYYPNNISLICTGKVVHEEIVEFVENYIEKYNITFENFLKEDISIERPKLNNNVIEYTRNSIEQNHLAFGLTFCPANSEEIYATSLLNNILGGNATSILFDIIREQMGLAYSINSYFEPISDYSILYGYAGFKLDQDYNEVIDIIRECILNIDKYIDENVLEKSKKYIIRKMSSNNESTTDKNMNLCDAKLYNYEWDLKKKIEKINAVTLEDISKLIENYIKEENLLFVILKNK